MFLQAVSAVPPSSLQGVATASALAPLFNNSACTSTIFNSLSPANLSFSSSPSTNRQKGFKVFASDEKSSLSLTGVIFQPFEEVKNEEFAVPISPNTSLARQRHPEDCEVAINAQINVDYSVSYAYHAMYAYFDRDNIALKGLAKFFKESSDKEKERVNKLTEYLNIRGGRVKLCPLKEPPSEYEHLEKGDALYAMELALSLEKVTNEKLLNLQNVAERKNDPQMADFIESEFLHEQVHTIKKISEYVTQLRMVGKGHGVWHFDQKLLHEGDHVH